VSNIVLYVVVHVSRETINFEQSVVDDGASESRIGVKAGGMGVGDMLEDKVGATNNTSGRYTLFSMKGIAPKSVSAAPHEWGTLRTCRIDGEAHQSERWTSRGREREAVEGCLEERGSNLLHIWFLLPSRAASLLLSGAASFRFSGTIICQPHPRIP
jgi:hypothetical protein